MHSCAMKRVAALTRHVTGVDVSASASEVAQEMSQHEFQRRKAASRKVFTGIQQLHETGAPPDFTVFDLDLFSEKDGVLRIPPKHKAEAMIDHATAAGKLEILKICPGPWQSAQTRDDQINWCRNSFLRKRRETMSTNMPSGN